MNAQEMIRSNIIINAAKTAAKAAPIMVNDVERVTAAWEAKVAFEEEFTSQLSQFDTHLFLSAFAAAQAVHQTRQFIQAQINYLTNPIRDLKVKEPQEPTPRWAHRAKIAVQRFKAFLV